MTTPIPLTADETNETARAFPDGFLWGAATSSFQIEGASEADGKSPSIWDVFCREEGRIKDGTNGDVACDHYRRFPDDVALIDELGFGAYRFSIAWTRVMPGGTGPVNDAGLDFYDRLVDQLLERGIRPFPTLYHWDLPQVLQEQGGWLSRSTAEAFADYTEAVVERLGDRIDTWTTLNEPFVSANHGHVTGEHAPGLTSMRAGIGAAHHLLVAHGLAGERIRSLASDARLAIVLNFTPLAPATDSEADRIATIHRNNWENRWYADPLAGRGYPMETVEHHEWDMAEVLDGDLDLISAPIDLLGVNYYTRDHVSAADDYEVPEGTPVNTMGWEIHPPSLGWLLRDLHDRYDFPRYLITENGAPMPDTVRVDGTQVTRPSPTNADDASTGRASWTTSPLAMIADDDRLAYIRDHLAEVHGAIADGCPIEGYLVWSLLDNFEWAWGYEPTFGIVEVVPHTLERIPKKSARWLADVARSNQLPPG